MNSKHLFLAALLVAGTSGLRAEFSVNSVVINARSDPKNAPAIVAMASIENPKYTLRLVRAATTSLPSRAVEITRSVLKVDPKDAPEIVRQAILGQPRLALQITTAAVALLPDQRGAIVSSAAEVAPVDSKSSITDLDEAGTSGTSSSSNLSGGTPVAPAFPSQPVDAGLISPSS
jgi:hypothetical protein